MKNIYQKQKTFVLITLSYWSFMLTDGALRMIVLLHFHSMGFTPIELAYLFLVYELAGIITNYFGGWLASRFGLKSTLFSGLSIQIVSLTLLLMLDKSWALELSIIYVMIVQGFSGIAKDLTKMSSKSVVKFISSKKKGNLFKLVSFLTGSKNALKGLGFLVGGLLLSTIGFEPSLTLMILLLVGILTIVMISISSELPSGNKKVRLSDIRSKSRNINYLSLARVFLFGSRDVWFVVGVPVYFYSFFSVSEQQTNSTPFFIVGSLMAIWVIFYGIVQAMGPSIINLKTKSEQSLVNESKKWCKFLFITLLIFTFLIYLVSKSEQIQLIITIILLITFGFIFAVNSSLHSYLILKFTKKERVALDVGFYYMANAFGRFFGTLFSGISYQFGGIIVCLATSTIMIMINVFFTNKLSINKEVF